jgi:hypothetical protein
VTFDQAGESRLGGISGPAPELLEQLPVRQVADRSDLEEHFEIPEGSPLLSSDHCWFSRKLVSAPPSCNATPAQGYSRYFEDFWQWSPWSINSHGP